MNKTIALACLSASLTMALCCATAVQAIMFDWATVGNPGNAADTTGFGAVTNPYVIGKTEITNAQYTEFLNAVAPSDPYELYNASMDSDTRGGITRSGSSGSYSYAVKPDSIGNGPGGADGSDYTYGDKPVVFVSWYDAIRFANWLHNGQGSGDTEGGAYTLLGGTPTPSNGLSIARNPGANWFLTSEDEWYKAAYHKNDGVTGNYWNFPTGTNAVPNNNLPSGDTGNSANFFDGGNTTGDSNFPMTDAGAYTLSGSPYGTFDQGGNVWEWNEALISSSFRGLRAGSWNLSLATNLAASSRNFGDPDVEGGEVGFRVASIPETSSLLLAALSGLFLLGRRDRCVN